MNESMREVEKLRRQSALMELRMSYMPQAPEDWHVADNKDATGVPSVFRPSIVDAERRNPLGSLSARGSVVRPPDELLAEALLEVQELERGAKLLDSEIRAGEMELESDKQLKPATEWKGWE